MTKIYPFQRTARWLSLGFLALALVLGSWVTASAQDKPEDPRKNDPRLDKIKEMKATHDLSSGEVVEIAREEGIEPESLSEHHAMLRKLVGHWNTQGRMYPAPGADPVESRGVARNEMILEGTALRMDYKGSMQGTPLVGIGFDGYDTDKKEHYSIWIDNLSTGASYEIGSRCRHEDGDVVSFDGEALNPETGQKIKTRSELTVRTSSSVRRVASSISMAWPLRQGLSCPMRPTAAGSVSSK